MSGVSGSCSSCSAKERGSCQSTHFFVKEEVVSNHSSFERGRGSIHSLLAKQIGISLLFLKRRESYPVPLEEEAQSTHSLL